MAIYALELAPKKIRVNALPPSVVETKLMISVLEKLPEEAVSKRRQEHP